MSEPASAPAPPSGRASRRRWLLVGATVVVVAAVVISVLALSGTFAPAPATTPGSPYPTYRGALATATSAARGVSGGSWSPIFASGLRLLTNVSLLGSNLTAELASVANCSIDWFGGTPPTLQLSDTPASVSGGSAAYWIFGFSNSSGAALIVAVNGTAASPLGTLTGTECRAALLFAAPLTSSTVVDSPVVQANVSLAGGAAWLAAHPDAFEAFEITPGIDAFVSSLPVWHVEYTTCGFDASTGLGYYFNATVAAATGAVTAHDNGTLACTGSDLAPAAGGAPAPPAGDLSARKAL